VTLMLLYCQLR